MHIRILVLRLFYNHDHKDFICVLRTPDLFSSGVCGLGEVGLRDDYLTDNCRALTAQDGGDWFTSSLHQGVSLLRLLSCKEVRNTCGTSEFTVGKGLTHSVYQTHQLGSGTVCCRHWNK